MRRGSKWCAACALALPSGFAFHRSPTSTHKIPFSNSDHWPTNWDFLLDADRAVKFGDFWKWFGRKIVSEDWVRFSWMKKGTLNCSNY